jgi:hypothetical protein
MPSLLFCLVRLRLHPQRLLAAFFASARLFTRFFSVLTRKYREIPAFPVLGPLIKGHLKVTSRSPEGHPKVT